MIDNLFTYEEFDPGDHTIQYYNCRLREPIDQYQVGEHFDCIALLLMTGQMELYRHMSERVPTTIYKFEIKVVNE